MSEKLTKEHDQLFEALRGNASIMSTIEVNEKIISFREQLREKLDKEISDLLAHNTDKQLWGMHYPLSDMLDEYHKGGTYLNFNNQRDASSCIVVI